MPSIPSEFTVTCDICGTEETAPTMVPDNWSQVAGPNRLANNPAAVRPAFLCPAHTASYSSFWQSRQPNTTITID